MGTVIGVVILAAILLYTVAGVAGLGKFLTVDAYRIFRYERRGICGQCKLPYDQQVSKPADQMYGPDHVERLTCPNGHVSLLRGNRRFAEW